jgi:hypothetical protein
MKHNDNQEQEDKDEDEDKEEEISSIFSRKWHCVFGTWPKIYKAKGSRFVGRWWDGAVCKLAATPFVASILNRLRSSVLSSTAID